MITSVLIKGAVTSLLRMDGWQPLVLIMLIIHKEAGQAAVLVRKGIIRFYVV